MRRGIKIVIHGYHKKNLYSTQRYGQVCSECFSFVATHHRYCWMCGCLFPTLATSGKWEYVAERRKDYQDSKENEWEEEEKQ